MRRVLTALTGLVTALLVMGIGGVSPQSVTLPPFPIIYSGNITVAGAPAPDGLELVAKVKDRESRPVIISNGRYVGLAVSLPDRSYVGAPITFHLGDIKADETELFRDVNIMANPHLATPQLDLTFPKLPHSILKFTPGIPITIPALGGTSVPGLPSAGLVVGALLILVGIAALRLTRLHPE